MTEPDKERIGAGPYVVAGLGFIPLIGVLFATIAIVIGIIKRRIGGVRLIVLGVLGISVTVAIYGTLFYKGFIERGGVFDDLRAKMANTLVTDLVKSIEYHKVRTGAFPANLEELKGSAEDTILFIYDPMFMPSETPFFYRLTEGGTNYYLLGVGEDREPFTADDVLPDIPPDERGNLGLLVHPETGSAPAAAVDI